MSRQRPGDIIPHQQEIEAIIDKRLEQSGSGAQVFEVTDLLVPAGTDWSFEGLSIGSFSYSAMSVVVYALAIELADPPVDVFGFANGIGGSIQFDGTGAGDPNNLGSLVGSFPELSTDQVATKSQGEFDTLSADANFYTDAATTVDITIVRARAAFLVI